MLAFAYYILKVVVCSAILFGYYWLFLRDKVFHAYNRFYLLAVVVLSLALPLVRFQLFPAPEQPKTSVIKMLGIVSEGDDYVNDVIIHTTKPAASHISFAQTLPVIYILISLFFLVMLLQMIVKIFMMLKRYQVSENEGIFFVNTNEEKGTPFSFFRYIFWNSAIKIETPSGSRIFRHEVAHIQEKHSLDKMFINIVLIVFWCNPIFWFIRKELNMIHEFIADKRAVEDGDTAAFAAMILEAAYPHHRMQITNNFFYSPIKRRLMMLTKDQHKRMNYISRLLVLPLGFVVFAAFTIKTHSAEKKQSENKTVSAAPTIQNISAFDKATGSINSSELKPDQAFTENKITVVIDAGHGGTDNGSLNRDLGYTEKALTLSLAKKIAALNTNQNIKLILTRTDDSFSDPKQKAAFTKLQNPDMFISIHMNSGPLPMASGFSGMEVNVPSAGLPQVPASQLLASAVIGSFQENYGIKVSPNPFQRKHGIWVIDANNIPSVIIEAGYICNPKDLNYLISEEGQEAFAKNVLNAINNFAAADKSNLPVSTISDSLGMYKGQKVTGIRMTNKSDKVELILANGKTAWVTVAECEKLNIKLPPPPPAPPVPPAAPGVGTPPPPPAPSLLRDDVVVEKNETQPQFPGGKTALLKFVRENIDGSTAIKEGWASGTYKLIVKFIVAADGTLSDIRSENYVGSKTAQQCIDLMKKSPKWIPAVQNGKNVNAYFQQPFTFIVEDEKEDLKIDASQAVLTGETKDIFQTYTRQVTLVKQPAILPLGERNILALRNGIIIDSKNIKLDQGDEVIVLKPAEAVAKYGPKASDGAIEIATQRTAGYDPVFRVANFTKSRLPAVQFINATKVSVTDGYEFVESTVYFSGKGFENTMIAKLTTANLTDLKTFLAECGAGTNVTFDNIKVKNAQGIKTIEGRTYTLY